MSAQRLLDVRNLKTTFQTRNGQVSAVSNMTFHISQGETVAIVGESGSGKSVTALSVLGLLGNNGLVDSGSIIFQNNNLVQLKEADIRKLRGKDISMVFQDPMTCLDPVYTIGDQIMEAIKFHEDLSKKEALKRAIELLEIVGIPDAKSKVFQYPHQMSGGQRQRVMIAIALACRPKLIIADEPTTALDVTVQAQILNLLKKLQHELGTAIMLVTHDLGVVAEVADRVVVMYAGQMVEHGPVEDLFAKPEHPYTAALLKSTPRVETNKSKRLYAIKGNVPSLLEMPKGCRFAPRCEYAMDHCHTQEPVHFDVDQDRQSKCWLHHPDNNKNYHVFLAESQMVAADPASAPVSGDTEKPDIEEEKIILEIHNLKKYFPITKGLFSRTVGHVKAVDGLSFHIRRGETVALVGESGCGKSTTGRLLLKLIEPTEGKVVFNGVDTAKADKTARVDLTKRMQIVFQDPYSSLNPRMTVQDIISEPLEIHKLKKGEAKIKRIGELLEMVGLSRNDMHKFPHQFSGGQRQRIGIARALATEPELLVCDEAVSALDVSIQAQILNLLKDLQKQLGLSYLFISHDLNVVKYISDRVCVMYLGEIVEIAETETLFRKALHPYSSALLASIPVPDPTQRKERKLLLEGEVPSPANPPSGCRFHTRCPHVMDVCKSVKPQFMKANSGQNVACHLY